MTPDLDVGALGPLLAVGIGAVLLPLLDLLLMRTRTFLSRSMTTAQRSTYLSLATAFVLVVALLACVNGFVGEARWFNHDNPMILMDRFSAFLNGTILFAALLTALLSSRYLVDMQISYGEYYALMLASVLGMMLLCASTDLMMLFVALELMSIPIYVLAGFRRTSLRSNESAVKYFLIGSFASAILVYGCALLYGGTGSISLYDIGARFDANNPLILIGSGLVIIGLAFKIASVPFHQWAPDVYEGAPTTVSAFMATAVKVAAFGALLRVVTIALQPASEMIYGAVWIMAVLSMTVGNAMAIIQQNAKRMLAYSSIAHAGYLLVGVAAANQAGYGAMLFYLLVYSLMTIGAFGVISVLAHRGEERERIADLAGLGTSSPFMAIVMAVCMVSLAGIPGTAGFMGKFYVFRAAVEKAQAIGDSSLIWLVVIAVLNSAVSLFYYLRVPMVMYMRDPEGDAPDEAGAFERLVLFTCAVAVILLGIWPQNLNLILAQIDVLRWATIATASLP